MLVVVLLLLSLSANAFNHNVLLKKALNPIQPPSKLLSLRKFGADIVNKSNVGFSKGLRMLGVDSTADIAAPKLLPVHENKVEGKLENGLTYVILPNSNPAGRFEAHLEILSGSAHELSNQQGIAHLLEHTVYMGSPKRGAISGTGSRTNAYTDFQHTVFFAACPVVDPDSMYAKPMLPLAFDALLDVMTCKIQDNRLEKERAAVLSEASMVNKIDYRVECQILSTLHNENRISKRFPIGKEEQLKTFTKEDLQLFHDTHYRPDNAVLYVVGDLPVQDTIETIRQKFGTLQAMNDHQKILTESGEFPLYSMKNVHTHFPPLVHRWSMTEKDLTHLLPRELIKPVELQQQPITLTDNRTGLTFTESLQPVTPSLPVTTMFVHENLKSFSFHLFAKRPIEPVVTELSLKRELMRRLALSALQVRLNVDMRQSPLFTMIDFNQVNWPREGCAVCSLDLTADVSQWKMAIKTAVQEVRRLGLFGLSAAELARYKHSMISEIRMRAVQSEGVNSEELVTDLMEQQAVGNTFLHPTTRLHLTESLLHSTTLSEVNDMAKELCEHLSHIQPALGVQPVAMIVCSPTVDRHGQPCAITEEEVKAVMNEAVTESVEQNEDTPIPDTLITNEQLKLKIAQNPPSWITNTVKEVEESDETVGVLQRKLSNGIRVNMKNLDAETQKMNLRVYVPGGRMLESPTLPGTVLLGTKTMQEGGAFLNMTREEVELFCIDHMIQVEISTTSEALIFDLSAPTTTGPGGVVTGATAALQVAHIILTDFEYEPDAFERAREAAHETFDSTVKGLESMCLESVTKSLCNGDPRYLQPNHQQLEALTVDLCSAAIKQQLNPQLIEVSIAGDLSLNEMQTLSLAYLGTIPVKSSTSSTSTPTTIPTTADEVAQSSVDKKHHTSPSLTASSLPPVESLKAQVLGRKSKITIFQQDSEERAMGYLAGPAPNEWGVMHDGVTVTHLMETIKATAGLDRKESSSSSEVRNHPAFAYLALQIFTEVVNRRLFTYVREERQLTYDANFLLRHHEAIQGGSYLVSVTSSPSQVQEALQACQTGLASLSTWGISKESVQAAKRSILNRFESDGLTNKGWVERMSGIQLESIPYKTIQSISDFENILNSVTLQDIRDLAEVFNFTEDNMTQCVGITASELPLGLNDALDVV